MSIDYTFLYNEEHINNKKPLTVISKEYNIKPRELSKTFKKLGLKIRINKFDYSEIFTNAFDILTNESSYWLGLIAADGSLNKNRTQIDISLKEDDFKHLLKFKKFLNLPSECFGFRNIKYKGETRRLARIYFSSKKIYEKLIEYNIVPSKSNLEIDFLSKINENFATQFIIGYFDGDGSFAYIKEESRYVVSMVGNKTFLKSVKKFLSDKFNFSHINIHRDKRNTYQLSLSHNQDVKLFSEIYLNTLNDELLLFRKKAIAQKILYDNRSFKCNNCSNDIATFSKSGLCSTCVNVTKRKTERPSKEELLELILTKPLLQIGKNFGVSDNAIRKWCKYYDLPYRKKDIEEYKSNHVLIHT